MNWYPNYKVRKAIGLGMEVAGGISAILCIKYNLPSVAWVTSGVLYGFGLDMSRTARKDRNKADRERLSKLTSPSLIDIVGKGE